MAEFKYTFNLDTTASGDGAEQTKAGIDAVTQSTNQAAEAQVKASSLVADALKEEFASLDALKAKAAERSAETKNTVDDTEAYAEQIEVLVDAVNRYNDALAAGDQEATIEALDEIKQGMDAVAASSDEIPPELEEINAELDELDKKVRGKKSFEKLSDQANGTSKSLKRIEKLQVAKAIGNIVKQNRAAGKSFSELGKEGESATDTALNAADAVGNLASGVAAGFAAAGPIGAGIALVTAGLSYFNVKAKEARDKIKATFDDVDTTFTQSKEAVNAVADAVSAYSEAYKKANDLVDLNLNKLQQALSIEQKKADLAQKVAEAEAERAKSKVKLDLSEGKITDDQSRERIEAIDSGLSSSTAEKEVADLKRQIKANSEKLKTTLEKWDLLNDAVDEAAKEVGKNRTQNEIKEESEFYKERKNEVTSEVEDIVADSNVDGLKELLEKYEGKNDDASRAEFSHELKDYLANATTSDGEKTDFTINLENLADSLLIFERKITELAKEQSVSQIADVNLKDAQKAKNGSEDAIQQQFIDQSTRKKNLAQELEAIKKIQNAEKLTVKNKKETEANNRKKAADEKRQREADKKQKEIKTEQDKAGQSVGLALDKASVVPGLTKEFKARITKAQAANADGTDSAEMKEVVSILNTLVSAAEKRSTVDSGLLSALQSQNAKGQAQDRKISQLSGDLKKFKQLYNNNRR